MDRPILFSAPMVRAILDGTKTQTRRLVKCRDTAARNTLTDPGWYADRYNGTDEWCMWGARGTQQVNKQGAWLGRCPYGQPGDRLWVRETWAECVLSAGGVPGADQQSCSVDGMIPVRLMPGHHVAYHADGDDGFCGRWRPSIHMPRWASRITLEVTGVRVERLCDISDEDAKSEGVSPAHPYHRGIERCDYVGGFHAVWDSIHGPGSWEANPWVWVVEFKRVGVP